MNANIHVDWTIQSNHTTNNIHICFLMSWYADTDQKQPTDVQEDNDNVLIISQNT